MRSTSRSFTLTELLITLAVIVILLGLSVGVLGRLGQKEELVAVHQSLRALLRRARNAAREERFRVTVEIDPDASELRAQQKSAVTQFRFEVGGQSAGPGGADAGEHDATSAPDSGAVSDDRDAAVRTYQGARGYELTSEDADPARGKIGMGLLLERQAPRGAAWAWVESTPALSPREGIHVSCWLFLGRLEQRLVKRAGQEPREEGADAYLRSGDLHREAPPRVQRYDPLNPPLFQVFRKGKAYGLAVTANYELEAFVTGERDGAEVTWISRTRADTLRANRWYRVELAFDGRLLRVIVDGIARYHLPVRGFETLPTSLIRDPAPFSISDPDPRRAFFGVIDEVKLAGIISSTRVKVPPDLALIAPGRSLRFDMLGQLDPAKHSEPFVIYLCNAPDVGDVLDPQPEGAPKSGTRTRDQQQEENQRKAKLALDPARYERFLKALPNLQERQVRRLIVDRTGLVSD